MTTNAPSKKDAERDLHHFLNLASAQLRHRLQQAQGEPYSARMNRMRMLEELIKEQLPTHGQSNPDSER